VAAEDPAIITVAPTGPLTTRENHPGLPVTPAEIGEAVAQAAAAGAAVAHVHARGPDERPTADPAVYAQIAREIRARCDIVVQASTGVGLDVSCEDRVQIIASGEVDVTMATLNPASMTFGQGTFSNPPWFVQRLAELMKERGIRPELEVYDFGHVGLCKDLVKGGLVQGPLQFSFVMGVRGGMPGDPALLPTLIGMLPEGSIWQAIGIGRAQLPLSFAALALGGNIRVGFEDNVYFHKGELAESNAQFVRRAVDLVHAAGREVATPSYVRERLGVT
jgi:3-keto-5-aminohexanoate cleavage enzyme